MLVDIHFHSYVYSPGQLELALRDIEENQILLCSVTCDLPDWKQTVEIAKRSKYILPMFGIHPEKARTYVHDIHSLEPYLSEALMFGEIGLDHIWVKDSLQWLDQEVLLSYFLKIAERDDKPIMLHSNGGEKTVLNLLDSYRVRNVIFHDYDCSLDILAEIVERGYYMTIGRVILEEYKSQVPNWTRFLELARAVPTDLLLTESDGPPRDRRMPSDVLSETINRVAEVRGESPDEIGELGRKNFLKILGNDKRFKDVRKLLSNVQ